MQERLAIENVEKWECGRPTPSDLTGGNDSPDDPGLMDLDPPPGDSGLEVPPGASSASAGGASAASGRYYDVTNDDDVSPSLPPGP